MIASAKFRELMVCWDFKRERSPDYTEPPEPVIEAIGNFINEDNPTWEGTATELIEQLSLDIKPNALSLKLNVNASKLCTLYFVQYSNNRTRKGRRIYLRYDENHPVMVEPEAVEEETPAEKPKPENNVLYINAGKVNDIAGEDYDRLYQEMLDNCLA